MTPYPFPANGVLRKMAVNGKRAFRIEGICAAVFIKIQGIFTGDSRRKIWNKYI